MRVIEPSVEILSEVDGKKVLELIEKAARTCYKSESNITDYSSANIIKSLIKNHHEAMLEHSSITVKFIVDRGVSHEMVRHRLASYAQESTRYCNYSKDKFDNEITVIKPSFLDTDSEAFREWYDSCAFAEKMYMSMLESGCTPQEARGVLPTSLKTEIVMTANIREWRHFFKLRALGTTGKPHPQIQEVAIKLLDEFKVLIPIVFDDLVIEQQD